MKEKVMSGSWFEEFLRPHKGPWHHQVLKWERRRRGSLKSWPLTEAVITFALNMPKCSCAVLGCGGDHFQGWGLEGWINQLCLLWGLFIAKIFLTTSICSKNTMFPVSSILWRMNFPEVYLSFGLAVLVSCECKTTQKIQTVLMSGLKKMFYPL